MYQQKIKIGTLLLGSMVWWDAHAQSSVNASGSQATGTGGTASYSVGQTAYTSQTSGSGSSTQGVQQPIELFTSTHEELEGIQLHYSLFPNPTAKEVMLYVSELRWNDLRYHLTDVLGKVILSGIVSSQETSISLETNPVGTYFLNVLQSNNEIKSFKILKNQ